MSAGNHIKTKHAAALSTTHTHRQTGGLTLCLMQMFYSCFQISRKLVLSHLYKYAAENSFHSYVDFSVAASEPTFSFKQRIIQRIKWQQSVGVPQGSTLGSHGF